MPYQHRKSSVASATKQSSRKSSGWPLLARLPSPQLWLLALLLLITAPSVPLNLIISPAVAAGSTTSLWPAHVTGYVYARNLVRDNNGNPIFATFDETGAVIEELPEYNDAEGDHILSADRYRSHQKRYQDYRNSRPKSELNGSKVRSKSAYESTQFTTLRDEVVSPKPILMSSTRSVLTRAKTQTFTPQTSPILFQSPIDLNNPDLNGSSQSVILDKNGVLRYESEYRIGYRSAYVKPRGGDTEQCRPAYNSDEDQRSFIRASEDEPCGPISGALVTTIVYSGREGGISSDQKGQYSLLYIKPPCPMIDIEYTSFIIPKLFYQSYNPRSLGLGLYYTVSTVYDYCAGAHEGLKYSGTLSGLSAYTSIVASIAAAPTYIRRLNIAVDVTVLNGTGHVGNSLRKEDAIPLKEKTEYQADLPQQIAIPPEALDLDGDRIPDPVEQEQKDYDGDGTLDGYGVYLNGKQPGDLDAEGNPILPDLIKRPDYALDTQDQGLLKTLSRGDLIDTDLYVYRTATNQLLFERKTLDIKESLEIEEGDFMRGQDTGIIDDGTTGFFYLSLLPSKRASYSYLQTDFETWQSKAKINPALHQREADHLRPGEPIKIIAINRATGYIGTVTTTIKNGASNNSNSSLIDFAINDIVMRPPNLKVEAKRVYKIESGLTRGEERNYLIGFEGAGLSNDKSITLTTTWLDHDGTALPSDLPGYTGRLAVVTSDRTISGRIAEFSITPGRNLELIKLADNNTSTNHYYLHINGKPPGDDPDFSSLAGEGLLEQRPEHYVPFKVAIYDEIETRKRRNQQRYAYQDGLIDTLSPIEGVYAWPYRPEMQFSIFDLEVDAIKRGYIDDQANDQEETIYLDGENQGCFANPNVNNVRCLSSSQYLELFYDLENPIHKPLDPFGTERELLFALGHDEITVSYGDNQTLVFSEMEHLQSLTANDLTALNLLQNSDAENILWEYAFFSAAIGVDNNRDRTIHFGPDDPNTEQNEVDTTTPENPYRFWINNDSDTNAGGSEQDTQVFKPDSFGNIIATARDLEDFAGLEIKMPSKPGGAYTVFIETGPGVNINLFEGAWKTNLNYVSDENIAEQQRLKPHVARISGGQKIALDPNLFDQYGTARFIFEAIAETPDDTADDNYIRVILQEGSDILAQDEVYVELKNIKHYYQYFTVGNTDQPLASTVSLHSNNEYVSPGMMKPGHDDEYILFVHGWRMKQWEKEAFGETAFKRLYWQGYKGKFGSFTWPTDYVNTSNLLDLATDPQNYGRSEAKARRAGQLLRELAVTGGLDVPSHTQVRVMAHSMGNVVVSEAIRNHEGGNLFHTYAASQAASVADAYVANPPTAEGGRNSLAPMMTRPFSSFTNMPNLQGMSEAWHFANTGEDMPPDLYSYSQIPVLRAPSPESSWSPRYYDGIGSKVVRMINLNNTTDYALSVWKTNQITKPDGGMPWDTHWGYSLVPNNDQYGDRYTMDAPLSYVSDIYWSNGQVTASGPTGPAEILAHITPAHSVALGHYLGDGGEINGGSVNLNFFPYHYTKKPNDHSAQFHESSAKRWCYWEKLTDLFRYLEDDPTCK